MVSRKGILDTWVKLGKQLKIYYTLHGTVNAFALWNMIRNVLDPRHEALDIKWGVLKPWGGASRGCSGRLK